MTVHDISCISCPGYNEGDFSGQTKCTTHCTVRRGRVKREKELGKKGMPRRNLKFKLLSARFILLAKSFAGCIGQRD